MSQQGDVKLFQTDDGGEITVSVGVVEMNGGLETAAYLSLFGGNEADAAGDDTAASWWANLAETDPALQYRSETQNLLRSLPITATNLRRVEDAAGRDLAWMVPAGAASSVTVGARIKGLNTIEIVVIIVADGAESEFIFAANWKATG